MKPKKFVLCLISLLLLIVLLVGSSIKTGTSSSYRRFSRELFGLFDTATVVVGYAENEAEFERYIEIIYYRMTELHRLFDIFTAHDGINNLYAVNAGAGITPVAVERYIVDLLLLAREGYKLSGGAVNVAMGPVLRIWHRHRQAGTENYALLPSLDKLREAALLTDINDMVIDEENNTVFLRRPGMSLDVGSVAKSFAAGLAAEAAQEAGMRSGLINSGGDVVAFGQPLDGTRLRWSVGVPNPNLGADYTRRIADTIFLTDKAVATSGAYHRYFVVDGQTFGHIIDPATLMPANLYLQVTVFHENAGLADLLSTALFILPLDVGMELAERVGAGVIWIDRNGEWHTTDEYARISRTLSG